MSTKKKRRSSETFIKKISMGIDGNLLYLGQDFIIQSFYLLACSKARRLQKKNSSSAHSNDLDTS